jgi:hypothetical protein
MSMCGGWSQGFTAPPNFGHQKRVSHACGEKQAGRRLARKPRHAACWRWSEGVHAGDVVLGSSGRGGELWLKGVIQKRPCLWVFVFGSCL